MVEGHSYIQQQVTQELAEGKVCPDSSRYLYDEEALPKSNLGGTAEEIQRSFVLRGNPYG